MPRMSIRTRRRPLLRLALTVWPRNFARPAVAFLERARRTTRWPTQPLDTVVELLTTVVVLTGACTAASGRDSGRLMITVLAGVGELVPGASGRAGLAPSPR